MLNVFFNNEILAAEKRIRESLHVPSLLLMENAGKNCSDFILKNFPHVKNDIIILSGKGNNAGDGFVIARNLINCGHKVNVLMLFPESQIKGDAAVNFTILKKYPHDFLNISYCRTPKELLKEIGNEERIVVDSIFGVGFSGEPDSRMKMIFEAVNSVKKKTVISVDVASGLHSYNQTSAAVKADFTLAIGAKKFASEFYFGKEHSGKVNVMNMGVSGDSFDRYNSRKIYETERKDIAGRIPERKFDAHKYTSGKVLVIAGSRGLSGAACMSSVSALRTGSGAVFVAHPKSLSDVLEVKLTEVMKLPLEETSSNTLGMKSYESLKEKLRWCDACLIGPGLSRNEETLQFVRTIVKENNLNFVIDADAIRALKNNFSIIRNKKIILTPHMGEFADLINKNSEDVKNDFYEYAYNFAAQNKVVLLLKNAPSVITDGKEFYINSTGHQNLATAGSGDVLSGIIVSLLSQGMSLMESSIAGAYIHGRCGDNIFYETGSNSTVAGDLITEIPIVKKSLIAV